MIKRVLRKTDGRALILYGRRADPEPICAAPSPSSAPYAPNAHLRWHPLRGEWVAYATHRQNRTFLPPAAYNPLAPTVDPADPTELPAGNYDVAVFENLFPTFTEAAHDPPALTVATARGQGRLRSRGVHAAARHLARRPAAVAPRADHRGLGRSLSRARRARRRRLRLRVRESRRRGRRHAAASARADLRLPVHPADPGARARERARILRRDRAARCSRRWSARSAAPGGACSTTVRRSPPSCRYAPAIRTKCGSRRSGAPPRSPRSTPPAARDLARALKTVLLKYDGLWNRPFPYIMAIHQAPDRRRRVSRGASAHRVLSGLPDARPVEVPRRQRNRRRRLYRRHRSGRQGGGAESGAGVV